VEEIVPDFVDPATDGPLAGREEEWGLVTEYRARLAMEELDWAEAERLQRVCVDWDRKRAGSVLKKPPDVLNGAERNQIRTLAGSLHELGRIQREMGEADCVGAFQESLELSKQIGEGTGAGICAFNLGHAYMNLEELRDLEKAERWYRRSLDFVDKRDMLGCGRCLVQLGAVAYNRFIEARKANRPEQELLGHLNEAGELSRQALDMVPPDAVNDLAVIHHQLGVIYKNGGNLDQALEHYRESIRCKEEAGHVHSAGTTRYNVAVALAGAGRLRDALVYAKAALGNFESYGQRAAADIGDAKRLIAKIKKDPAEQGKK
jgi:tetratricopeptide (TPR) repeat protein